tara:strand:+ start:1039 stop:1302 length:264 start_codon:yes stop_codon:yes gene_type:complete
MKKIQIDEDCQFLKDIESEPNYNGVPLGVYNLIITIGALKLWNKEIIGVKTRNFRLRDVKKYFGITGNAKTLLYKLQTIDKVIKGDL